MTGTKVLVAAAMAALFFLLPSIASAQPVPPHGFLGSATVNGSPAVDGTSVAAFVDGRQIASVVVSGGSYSGLLVEQPEGLSFVGELISFTIGGLPTAETAIWTRGELTVLNLNGVPSRATPVPVPATPTPIVIVGEKGGIGPPGPSGPQGVQGASGPSGAGGPAGPAGQAGPAGAAGASGSQGLGGQTGSPGETGSSLFAILALVFSILAFLGAFGGLVWRWLVE